MELARVSFNNEWQAASGLLWTTSYESMNRNEAVLGQVWEKKFNDQD